jgi:hypothetical protein
VAVPGPTIEPGPVGTGGYRRLVAGEREAHVVRTDLGGALPSGRFRGLVAFVQVSDLHITDGQSPGRAEYLDRLGDDDSGVSDIIGPVGTYRAQESLTHHVVEAMTARLRRIDTAPLTGLPLTFAVSTGDATVEQPDRCVDLVALRVVGGVRPPLLASRRHPGRRGHGPPPGALRVPDRPRTARCGARPLSIRRPRDALAPRLRQP